MNWLLLRLFTSAFQLCKHVP